LSALIAGSERWLITSPSVTRAAPPLSPPDEAARDARLFVLRI
jgi:hypothetical protein